MTTPLTISVLTPLQGEILKRFAEGASTLDIADERKCSPKTIEYHRTAIMKMLRLFSIAELTNWAISMGITPLMFRNESPEITLELLAKVYATKNRFKKNKIIENEVTPEVTPEVALREHKGFVPVNIQMKTEARKTLEKPRFLYGNPREERKASKDRYDKFNPSDEEFSSVVSGGGETSKQTEGLPSIPLERTDNHRYSTTDTAGWTKRQKQMKEYRDANSLEKIKLVPCPKCGVPHEAHWSCHVPVKTAPVLAKTFKFTPGALTILAKHT